MTIKGQVEPGKNVMFRKGDFASGKFMPAGAKLVWVTANHSDGVFQIGLDAGTYSVRVDAETRWVITVPVEDGVYDLNGLIVYEFVSDSQSPLVILIRNLGARLLGFLLLKGGRMQGKLLLNEPGNASANPLQAVGAGYLRSEIAEVTPYTFTQTTPVMSQVIDHPHGRNAASVTVTTLDGHAILAPWRNVQPGRIEVSFNAARAFVAAIN